MANETQTFPEYQKPQPGVPVLARYFNCMNKQRIVKAVFIPKYFMEDDGGAEIDLDYLHSNDNYYWPEGWYERSEEHEPGYMLLSDQVIDWMPMPEFPPIKPDQWHPGLCFHCNTKLPEGHECQNPCPACGLDQIPF